jgi:lipopolysaccharide biosynthesis glycosyltransferase
MTKNLVFQVNVPAYSTHKKFKAYTYIEQMYETSERNARNYAKKYNADYIKIDDPHAWAHASGKHVTYQKLKVYDFENHERFLYIDSDYIIKDNAPNLFELCGDKFHAVTDPGAMVNKIAANLGIPRERYFNAGFFYITKEVLNKSRETVIEYIKRDWDYEDQGLWNRMFFDLGINYYNLSAEEWNQTETTFGVYGDHYAGAGKSRWGTVSY